MGSFFGAFFGVIFSVALTVYILYLFAKEDDESWIPWVQDKAKPSDGKDKGGQG